MVSMKKPVNLRLDCSLLDDIKNLGGSRTEHINKALQLYLQSDTQCTYNVDMVQLLQNEVSDLRVQRDRLQHELQYYRLPWYVRLFKNNQLLLKK